MYVRAQGTLKTPVYLFMDQTTGGALVKLLDVHVDCYFFGCRNGEDTAMDQRLNENQTVLFGCW